MSKKADPGDEPGVSRRRLLTAGVAAAAIPVFDGKPAVAADTAMGGMSMAAAASTAKAPELEGLETLNANEADMVEAICARLIPSDDKGPGAREARAAHYIDRALAGPLSSLRQTYASGLEALDAYAQSSKGAGFADLAVADQDKVLHDVETNAATGFTPNSSSFFALLRAHTIQGTFSDPYYGGNANFVGWDLVGYPGLRMPVEAEDQRLVKPVALRKSVYDGGMFSRGGKHDH